MYVGARVKGLAGMVKVQSSKMYYVCEREKNENVCVCVCVGDIKKKSSVSICYWALMQ